MKKFIIFNIIIISIFAIFGCSSSKDKKSNTAAAFEEKFENKRFDANEVAHRQIFDMNGDHVVDLWKFYKNKQADDEETGTLVLLRKEIDSNFDGRVDIILFYNDKEELVREEHDTNFDGIVDTLSYYSNKQLQRIERFTEARTRYLIDEYGGEPGYANSTFFFRKNVMTREEIDRNADGHFDTVTIFNEDGTILQTGDDRNGDGLVDDWKRY